MTAPTKTPIDPSQIRFGDLIRWESTNSVNAREFRQTDPHSRHTKPGTYYLLDRPIPPVDLPSTPALGWIATDSGSTEARFWRYEDGRMVDDRGHRVIEEVITEFTLATAVPSDALNGLRELVTKWGVAATRPGQSITRSIARLETIHAVENFLAAVDEATS